MALLEESIIRQRINDLEEWSFDGFRLHKEFNFTQFRDAIGFINRIADVAEASNHHPDIENHWTKVTVGLRSWSEGGITESDLLLASAIEAVASSSLP